MLESRCASQDIIPLVIRSCCIRRKIMDDLDNLISKLNGLHLGSHDAENCFVCREICNDCRSKTEFCQCRSANELEELSRVKPSRNLHLQEFECMITNPGEKENLIDFFEELDISKTLAQNLKTMGYKKPTAVQKTAIPYLLSGRDMVACAPTGTGKTVAFLIPTIMRIMQQIKDGRRNQRSHPYALVLVPTRELAVQILREAKRLTENTPVNAICLYNQMSVNMECSFNSEHRDILIGTPGKIEEYFRKGDIYFDAVKTFILDEADHMFERNFKEAVKWFVKKLPRNDDIQSAVFCATLPRKTVIQTSLRSKEEILKDTYGEIHQVLLTLLQLDYVFLCIGTPDGTHNYISQKIIDVQPQTKRKVLIELLQNEVEKRRKCIVFVETKVGTANLAKDLCQLGLPVTVFHRNRSQRDRCEALWQFNEKKKLILVCTSVSARGLDIFEVNTVINYDLPSIMNSFGTYLYRVGRTGRAGNKGDSISFFQRGRDEHLARGLVNNLSASEQEVPNWLDEIAERELGTSYGRSGKFFAASDTRPNVKGKAQTFTIKN